MNTKCRLTAVITTLTLASVLGCQHPSAINNPSDSNDAPPTSTFIERPRILDDSGNVVSELFFPPGQNQRVLKMQQGLNFLVTRDLKINGRDVGWILIDTGANITTLDEMAANDLNLPAAKPEPGADNHLLRAVKQIELAGIALNNHVIGVGDFKSVRTVTGVSIQGSLGGDFLGQMPFCLDFTDQTLTFYQRTHFQPPAGAREVQIRLSGKPSSQSAYARANPTAGSPLVAAKMNQTNCKVVLDTGSSNALMIAPQFCRQHPEFVDWEKGIQNSTAVFGGSAQMYRANVQNLNLFGQTLPIADTYAEVDTPNRPGLPKHLEAVVGCKLLENYRLTFDYASGRMWVENRPLPSVAARLAGGMNPNTPDIASATPLMIAAKQGDLEGVKALLQVKARIEGSDAIGRTALMFAVQGDNADVVQTLLQASKANINDQTVRGETALMWAMGKRSEEAMVKMLLQAGADVSLADRDGETAAHNAARRSGGAVIQLLAAQHANLNTTNRKGWRPLDLAVILGQVETFKALWQAGARSSGKDGLTLLHLAAANRNNAMIRHVLLGKESSVAIDAQAADDKTPLMVAAQEGHVQAAELLLQAGAKVNLIVGDNTELTALIAAAQNNHPEVIELLLRHQANLELSISDGTTPLMAAAGATGPEAVAMLLKCGAQVNTTRSDGVTALHWAAEKGNVAAAQLLIQAGARIDAFGPKGLRPLTLAVAQQKAEMVRLLLDAGADPVKPTSDGYTPLQIAKSTGNANIVKLLEDTIAKSTATTKSSK